MCIRDSLITAHQHNAPGVFIAKERNRVVGALLQVAETDDIAEGLDGVQTCALPIYL